MADIHADPLRAGRKTAARPGADRLWSPLARAAAGLHADRGAVTAEYAALLPVAVLVIAGVVATGGVGLQQVRNQDAAGAAARIIARGDSPEQAARAVARMAGEGASLEHHDDGTWVSVTVARGAPGPLGWFPDLQVKAEASAPNQQAQTGPAPADPPADGDPPEPDPAPSSAPGPSSEPAPGTEEGEAP